MATVTYPIAPATETRNGTLLDSVTVQDGIQWLVDPAKTPDAPALFESYAEMNFDSVAAICASNAKTFDESGAWVDGFFMAAYGGVKCNAVGGGVDMAKVRETFDQGESTAVEAGLMRVRFTDAVTNGFAAVTDLTPAGGAVKPKVGMALLEGWMSRNYVGQPILHLPTVIASLVMGADGVALEANILRTKLGSKVVSGAGYDYPNIDPTGAENTDAATRWIYASGGILVRRGEPIVKDAFNQSNNEVTVLAERGYVVAVDGPVAAIEVQVNT